MRPFVAGSAYPFVAGASRMASGARCVYDATLAVCPAYPFVAGASRMASGARCVYDAPGLPGGDGAPG